MEDNSRKRLYDKLSESYNLGTFEEFDSKMGNDSSRRALYDKVTEKYDIGTFEEFNAKMGNTHKQNLDAFNSQYGSFMNDFESRDTAETKMSRAGMSSGLVVPAEGSISGEERQKYLELHKQEEALKRAWYNSPDYLAQKDADALLLSQVRDSIDQGRLEFAQANPMIEGYNPSATRGAEADKELQMYETASRIMHDAIKLHNAPSKYDGKNAFVKFGKGSVDTLSDLDFWTAGLTEITDNFGVRDVLNSVQSKLGNLNDLSEEAIEDILSPAEKAVLQAWAINAQEQVNRKDDLARAYQAGQSATESLGFMAEFALTGGVGKATSEGVEAMAKWLGRKVLGSMDEAAAATVREMGEKIAKSTVGKYGARLADALAETAGKTLVMPSTFRNISEKAAEIQEDAEGNRYLTRMNDAFAKGFTDSFIENLSEGGRVNALGDLIGDVAGKIPAYKKIVDKFANSKAGELLIAFNSSGIMNTLRAGGWHGFGEEYLEEWYGNALRTITGLDKDALKDFATVDNQLITITSFLPMTIFGGTVSTAQVLSAKKGLDKKAEMLRSALLERGYDEKQADNMIDMMRGASPAEISQTLTPIINAVALRDLNEAAALMKPVGEFAEAVRRWQSFDTKYQYQEQEQRDNLRTQMEETLGQFWQEDENGRQTVQRGVNANGEVVYLLGKPSAADAQSGTPQQVAAITSDGRKVFVDPSAVQLEGELEMNDFLGTEIMAEKGNKEQARMVEEKERALAQVRQMSAPGTTINLGTTEAPVFGTVAQRTPDGVVITMQDGTARQVSYEELGNYVGVNTTPLTDAQMDERDADALSADRAQREAELDMEYENLGSSENELTEAEAEVEQAVEAATPLPTKADGSVDQTALWNTDPARWAQWNDEQRQDDGAHTASFLLKNIQKLRNDIMALNAEREANLDPEAEAQFDAQIDAARDRMASLINVFEKYVPSDIAQQMILGEQAMPTQTGTAPATTSEQTAQQKPQTEDERRKPLRQKAKELSDKLGVKVNIAESLSDVKEESAREQILRIDVSGSSERATGWYNPTTGEVTIYLPHTTDTKEIEKTIVHEVVAHKGLRGLLGQEGFNVLCDSVWEMMTEEERQKYLAYPGVNGNKRAAADEYIAHYAETMNLEESKPVWDRIVDLIVRILNSMGVRLDMSKEQLSDIIVASYQKLVKEASGQTEATQATEVSDSQLTSSMNAPISSEGKVTNNIETDNIEEEINPAFVEAISTDVDDAEYSQFLDDKAFQDPQPAEGIESDDIRFSIVKEGEMRGNTQAYFDKHYKGGKLGKKDQKLVPLNITHFTQELLNVANAQIEEMRKYMLPFLDMESKGKRFLPAEVYGKSTLFDNSSYGKTMENTLICTRTLAYIDFVEEVKKRIGRPLTATESFLASQMLYDIAIDPQCLYCYVSLDRKAYDEFLLRYVQQRDEVISKWNASDKSAEAKEQLYKEFLDGRKPTSQMQARFESWLLLAEGDNAITTADLATKARRGELKISEVPEAWEKARDKYKKLKGEKKLAYAASEEYQTALWNYLASPLGQVTDAEAYAQSASWAKKEEDYRSYTGELLNCTADALKGLMGHYGLRFYSFSEYSPAFILENMQMVRDAAARGLKGFAYTKEVDFIRIFAPTGMNINCSVYGRVDSEGNVVPDTKQGADWAQVQALREQYPNVGAVFVATNDEMVEWALNQPWIDVIIPFHIVRTGADIAKFYEWTNYTSMSADTTPSGKSTYVYPHEHHNDKETFLQIAQERGLTPRFADVKLSDGRSIVEHENYMRLVNETRRSVDETPILTPTFNVEAAKESFDAFVEKGGYYSGYFYEDEAFEQGIETVVEDIKAGKTAKDVEYGRQDVPIDVAKIMAKRAEMERKHGKGPVDILEEAKNAAINDVMFRFVGEQAAARLDSAVNATMFMDNLQTAREMEEAGADARVIKRSTGWERGADGMWRHEMPDFEIKAKPGKKKTFKLQDLITDSSLFIEYPQMKDVKVRYKKMPSGLMGQLTEENGKPLVEMNDIQYVALNPKYVEAVEAFSKKYPELAEKIGKGGGRGVTAEEKKIFIEEVGEVLLIQGPYLDLIGGRNTLAHELQHLIQQLEGFAEGGSSDMVDTTDPAVAKENEELKNLIKAEIMAADSMVPELNDLVRQIRALRAQFTINARLEKEYDQKRREWLTHKDNVARLRKERAKLRRLGSEGYKRLAGEVEARNVEERINLTDEQRRESLIADTQDVATEDQIFLRGNLMTTAPVMASEVSFRITPEQDKAYMNAVKAGDMETAQRMVLEAAKAAMPNTKVVDENGNPRIVYHGGSSTFNKFDTSLGDGMTDLGQGSYFSSTEEVAREYTVPNGDNQWQVDNYIEEHPYLREMSRTQLGLAEAERIAIGEVFKNAKVYPVFLNMENPYYTTMEDFASGEFAHLYNRDGLRGYDGIIDNTFADRFEEFAKGAVQYVAFEPSQIKSADAVTYDDEGNIIPLSERFNPENDDIRFSIRSEEQREKLFADAKEKYGVTDNFNAAGYMLPDGSLLDFSEANDGGDPNSRSLDHRDIEGVIMDNGVEYDSRWMYIADFMNEGAIRLLPESAGINMIQAPTEEQRKKIFDFIYKYNGEVILEINDERLNSIAYMEYDRRTSPSRIFRDIDGYFNDGIVPQQDVRFRMSNENQAIFVSNAAKAVEGIKQEKATPEQWLKMLEKAGGLKAGEDKWMGLSDWLKASDKKTLTKQEVLDFINENMIVIEEAHYTADAEDDAASRHDLLEQTVNERYKEILKSLQDIEDYDERRFKAFDLFQEELGEFADLVELDWSGAYLAFSYEDLADYGEFADMFGVDIKLDNPIHDTRLAYTTPGLDNHHEIALTVPTIEPWEREDELHFGDAGDGRAIAWIRFGETEVTEEGSLMEYEPKNDVERDIKNYIEYAMRNGDDFNTSVGYAYNQITDAPQESVGWTEEAVTAVADGMRGTARVRKVLVIDEIQSNRHQEGREKGYKPDWRGRKKLRENLEKADREVERIEAEMIAKYGSIDKIVSSQDFDALEAAKEARREARLEFSNPHYGAIPDAPFDKNWHELAMKRMLRYAAENGYDGIAWTKGDQQAERYDMGGVVESIYYAGSFKDGVKDIDINLDTRRGGNIHLQVDNNGEVINEYNDFGDVENSQYIGKNLSEILGKELANKVLSLEEEQSLSGEGLRVGGEGMKGFYDKMLPAFMNKYGKKWGVKVEDIDLPNLGKYGYTMHSVPVTEEMKASVMEGQVMFRTTEITPEVRDEMDVISATALINGTYMQAPNGKPTNLTAEQWAMVRTKNFLRWFGDWINDPENASKVVDENGEPKVVYHGSPNAFTAFDKDMIGENTDSGFYGRGFYFATTEDESRGYGKYVIPAFLSMQNPLDLNELYAISDKWDGATADGAVRWWYGLASMFPNDAISETAYASIGGEDWTIMDLKNRIDELAETSDTPFADAAEEFGIDEDFFDMMGEGDVNLPDELTDALKANEYDGVINAGVENNELVALYPSQIKSATDNTGEFSEEEGDIRYRVVTDPAKIEELENGPKIKVYRAMQLIDGKLYPPMSAKVDGQLREPIELGQWEEAEERPDLADNKGYFKLDKGNKKSLKARYNPYFHTSYTPLNDQFSEAQDRPNLVTVEVEIPESELSSGYKADKAKDSVGEKEWKAGVIQGKLSGTRKVILSRWDKPIRIVPDSEVADEIVKMFEGKDIVMPSNVVTPSLRTELEKRGVPFVETDNQGKKLTNIAEMTTPIWSSKGTFANLEEAEKWAKENLQGKSKVNRYTGERISIGANSISKMLSPKAQKQSSSVSAHLAALKSVLDFIQTGIPAEVHADQEGRDFDVLRLYNAIEIDNKLYRVKSTVRKVRQGDKFYTYEVQEMELIEERWSSQKGEADNPRNPDSPINSITGAKLLKGVKKSNSKEGILPESENVSFRVTGTPTEDVVASGLDLTPAQTAELAGNIFAALPEESRKKITEGLSNVFDLKDAILQIPTSLAMKEKWNDEDRQMADIVAEQLTKMAGEMTRPFSASEGLWVLYNALNPTSEYDILSQASRAIVQRNLGFDAETLRTEEAAEEGVRFRTVGDASANARASLYNRGAVNVWTRLKESFVDMHASVEKLVKAIEKASGKAAEGFENILMALNQQSSKGLAAMEAYEQKFLNKMLDEIRAIMDKTDFKYEDIVRYVILKHGLERNEKMAQRDAREFYRAEFEQKVASINADQSLTDAQKQALIAAAQQELDSHLTDIDWKIDAKFMEFRERDYSGISSMFYDTLGVNRKDYATEEEYQAALMQAKQDKYATLADIEAAAMREVANFETLVNTDNLWDSINKATKEILRQQYEANMISKDQYETLRDMYDFYVPLRGFADNTAEDMYTYYRQPNSSGYTKPILGAEGRKTEAESPFGWIAAMAGSAIASNVKNEAKLALYYFVANRPDNGIATLSRTWYEFSHTDPATGKKVFKPAYPPFTEDLSSDAAKAAYEQWQEDMKQKRAAGLAYESGQRLNLGNAVVNISDTNKPEHIVNVKIGGKDYTIIINGNPRAAQAINGDLNIESTSQDYSSLFGPVLRWMSSVNTSYNPEFWITNMMRDMAFTWMAVNTKEDPAYRRKFAKNYRKAFQVISLVAKNEKGTLGSKYLEQMYQEFVQYGGVTGYTQIKDNETWEKEIDSYLRSNAPGSRRNGLLMRSAKKFFHGAHRFGESLEQISRFAAFLTSREMGKSTAEAINDAKEITVNFNRKGSGKMITLEEAKYLTDRNGQPLNKFEQLMAVGLSSIAPLGRRFIMFFNAAIQGLNATYKLWKKNPSRFVGWTLAYTVLGAMNAVVHAMLDDDDDYLDMPQYERRNSLMLGFNGVYVKWALPQEARAFYALGDLAVESIMGRNPQKAYEKGGELGQALSIVSEVLPINPTEGWRALLPSAFIPAAELIVNEDYKGDPIYNEQKWLSKEERSRTAKWSKAYQGTGQLYVSIAKGLNAVTGGDEHDAGLINLQPEKMEHIVQSAFGGTIRTADKFVSTIMAAIDPDEDVTIRQFPFLNRILTLNDERFKNVHVNDVFDYYKADAEHALTLEKQYKKNKDRDALDKLRDSDEYQWAKIYSKYKKPLDKIQEKIKVADGTAERKELMQQQDELKRQMIKEISELP